MRWRAWLATDEGLALVWVGGFALGLLLLFAFAVGYQLGARSGRRRW